MWMKYVMWNGFYWWEEGHNEKIIVPINIIAIIISMQYLQ